MSQYKTYIAAFMSSTKAFESEIVVALVALVVAYYVASVARSWRSNLPPGPFGLPIVGYLPFMTKDPVSDFYELGKKYGDVFRIKMGSETVVILHGVEFIKEALSKPEFLGRPPIGPLKLFNDGSAFFMDDVHKWREQRRFVVQSMKDLGLGKTQIEGEIMDEIHHFLEILRNHDGRPMDVKEPLSPSMSNNICTLVFGKRYDYEDPDRVYLDKNLDVALEAFSQTSIAVFFPWILNIPLVGKLMDIDIAKRSFNNLKKFFRQEITKHKDTFDSKNIRDFIDSFFVESASRKVKESDTTFSGKRVCPGEPMAIMEMFLYFTSILQKFKVAFPEGYTPTFKATLTGVYRLDPYKIRFLSKS